MKHIHSVYFVLMLLLSLNSGCYLLMNKDKNKEEAEKTTTEATTEEKSEKGERGEEATPSTDTKAEPTRGKTSAGTFSYTPHAPVNGKLKGVVELGASGFNSFIVTVDEDKNWKLENAEFGASMVYESMATTEDIKTGLKNYIAKMVNFGVKNNNVQFVVSSGAAQDPKVSKIVSQLKAMGYVVNAVTAEQEGKLAARTILPNEFKGNSFVVDIGSGNTKITWEENGQLKSFETYGSKYYDRNASDDQVYKEVVAVAGKVPSKNRVKCFIIGGVPYELANQHRNAKERYTVLHAPDEYSGKGAKIKSGLNIYKGIVDATNCDTFVFDWDSNFTIGYLLGLKY